MLADLGGNGGKPGSGPRRRGALTLVLAGLTALGTGAAGLILVGGHHWTPRPSPAAVSRAAARSADLAGPSLAATSGLAAEPPRLPAAPTAARPVALAIPAIGVRAHLIQLGLTQQGTLQVPASPQVPGWYAGGPRPGEVGPAIIAGHIDSFTGPGIFFRLRLLRPGNLVYVRRADGTTAVFGVYAVRMYAKDRFPTSSVYGPTPDAELRLITCGGTFDTATRSYLSNVVVYGRLVR
jgi:sortase (surface protein transpeptidase)